MDEARQGVSELDLADAEQLIINSDIRFVFVSMPGKSSG
jgi:hypothetical protein